jgi:hypothetical protein
MAIRAINLLLCSCRLRRSAWIVFQNQDAAAAAKEKLNLLNVPLTSGPTEMSRLLDSVRDGTAARLYITVTRTSFGGCSGASVSFAKVAVVEAAPHALARMISFPRSAA